VGDLGGHRKLGAVDEDVDWKGVFLRDEREQATDSKPRLKMRKNDYWGIAAKVLTKQRQFGRPGEEPKETKG